MSPFAGESADKLRARLKRLGLSERAISAAWPGWWSGEAERSASARAELRLGVARRLGLDPRTLLDDEATPEFAGYASARFKHLADESELERAGISSFGRSVASILLSATPPARGVGDTSALEFRQQLLDSGRPFVDLLDLMSLSWAVGVPVVHLHVFPWPRKRMAAMTVRIGDRSAVLLAKEAHYPAPIAFYLGHEIGHIALGHVAPDRTIVDLDSGPITPDPDDEEEAAADQYALELLTGQPKPRVLPMSSSSSRELARVALGAAEQLQIEPGTLALCFGYSTGNWKTANGALKLIYGAPTSVSTEVNRVAWSQIDVDAIPPDASDFLKVVFGQEAE